MGKKRGYDLKQLVQPTSLSSTTKIKPHDMPFNLGELGRGGGILAGKSKAATGSKLSGLPDLLQTVGMMVKKKGGNFSRRKGKWLKYQELENTSGDDR